MIVRARKLRFDALEDRCLLSINPLAGSSHEHLADAPALDGIGYLPPSIQLLDFNANLSGPAAGEPLDIALSFLTANAARLGLTAADLAGYEVTDIYTSPSSQITHIYLGQTFGGLDVENAKININLAADGSVINVGSTFVSGLTAPVSLLPLQPPLNAPQAIAFAAAALGLSVGSGPALLLAGEALTSTAQFAAPEVSLDPIPAELYYVPNSQGGVDLAWNLVIRTPDGESWLDLGVSVETGDLLFASNWTSHATYNVFDAALENPTSGSRTIQNDLQAPLASPFGWHDTNGVAGAESTDTRGNNVSAQEDRDRNDTGGLRPNGGAGLSFNFPIDLNQPPLVNQNAAITQLFYLNNTAHDVFCRYGFTEAAGNFQFNNYGRGGIANDHVLADAQDGLNNAFMSTPADGASPRMIMGSFAMTYPNRDASFDNAIMLHEYGHGVTSRLTGGPADPNALTALQSGGMDEGWSDFFALMFAQTAADQQYDAYPLATFSVGQANNGAGIRRVPYSFDMAIDPLTLGSFNGGGNGTGNNARHSAGEIWCSTLWDMSWLLINRYGFNPDIRAGNTGHGNTLALQLVITAQQLQGANPSFLTARNAILQADANLTGGANQFDIWLAFARRGMGWSAVDNGATSTVVGEAFDMPPVFIGTFPSVTATTPADGGTLTTGPSQIVVSFSEQMNASFLSPRHLELTGPGVGSITVTGATLVNNGFTAVFTLSGGWGRGVVNLRMTAGLPIGALTNGRLISYSAGDFTVDPGTGDADLLWQRPNATRGRSLSGIFWRRAHRHGRRHRGWDHRRDHRHRPGLQPCEAV